MTNKKAPRKRKRRKVKVIDLFCGIGGMTHGFVRQGFDVVAGIDIDETCRYAYEKNNQAQFIHKDISKVTAKEVNKLFGNADIKVLIGCAPCQPFSNLNLKRVEYTDTHERWGALEKFIALIREVKPEIVSMENVKELQDGKKFPIFSKFVRSLRAQGYKVSFKIVDASRYGVPQNRHRLVLLASRLGEIKLIPETHNEKNLVTIRKAIAKLPRISDGQIYSKDFIHRASKLSPLNKRRIQATPRNGGSAKSWSKNLMLECHKKQSGKSYQSSVYGRMWWDKPGPTMTTHCVSLGTGRFGHPSQNRAISLREAALIQSFPKKYRFAAKSEAVYTSWLSQHIGNAVPVKLGEAIALSIRKHIRKN
jgi:DNA (cytosine-5)-methyltransferase 1